MSLITRFNGAFKAFASEATGTFRTVFGGTTQSNDLTDNLTNDFKTGWEIVGTNDEPTIEDFNAIGYTLSQVLAYIHQVGIIEWSGTDGVVGGQDYYANKSYVGHAGDIYLAILDSGGAIEARVPTNVTYWKKVSSAGLDINGQTDKPTPTDTDNFVIQEVGGLIKKLSCGNLKAALSATWVANDSRAKIALNANGIAPIYACRAFVNFNGTGTVAIRASGNVSSITDNGTGDYTLNFTTAIPDANYTVSIGQASFGFPNTGVGQFIKANNDTTGATLKTTTQLRVYSAANISSTYDSVENNISIFR